MSDLKTYFQENRDLFDTEEPDLGHFLRFEKKIGFRKQGKLYWLKYSTKIASIVVLIVLSTLWANNKYMDYRNKSKGITLSDISKEYKEVEIYYTKLISERYNALESTKLFDSKKHKTLIETEIKELDSLYYSLQSELKTNRNDERIIRAMIQHYQLKVELINQIIGHLNEINIENETKKTSHEKNDI